MEHTPGPWEVRNQVRSGNTLSVYTTGEWPRLIADIHDSREQSIDRWQAEFDARLVAAAPRMLAALKAIIALDDGDKPDLWHFEKEFGEARAAIAKATQD